MSTARYRQSCVARASFGTAPASPTNLEIGSDSSVAISAATSSTVFATVCIAPPPPCSAPAPLRDALRFRPFAPPPDDAAESRSTKAVMMRRTASTFWTRSPAPSSATVSRSPAVAWSSTAATRSSRSWHVLADAPMVMATWRRWQRNAAGRGASSVEGSTATTDSTSARCIPE
ncbi:Os11g0118350 [Oryza sativa Japonica Group]|uniref:Os11g0118350 protein n=1 Tax=Oryza sativa subsp. japonica TaxID=39947 RepID=A0A0P0XYM5_ORYSJ|nr:Os11g0118350 [Oryza sativa Japonica Group]